ncbi:MAG: toprim domain-containing protein [Alphaproteobacteria bacterium]
MLTEGQVDVITLHQAGFKTTMAPLGTAVTEDHLRLLWKMSDTPILCFDGDNAGKKAAVRAVERALPLLQSGKSLKVSFLPDGVDPDDLLKEKNGKEKLNGLLKSARSLSEVLWHEGLKTRETSSPEHQAGLEKELTEKYNQIQDPVLKMHLIRDLKSKLWNAFRQRKTVHQRRTIAFSGSEEKKFIELLALYPNLFLEWEERILHLIDNKIIRKCFGKLANRQPLLEEEKREIKKYQTLKLLSLSEKNVKDQLQKLIDHQSIKALEEERNTLKKQFAKTAAREDWELIQNLEKDIQKLKEQNESV